MKFFRLFGIAGNKNSNYDSRSRNSFCVMTCHLRLSDRSDKSAKTGAKGKMPEKNSGDLVS